MTPNGLFLFFSFLFFSFLFLSDVGKAGAINHIHIGASGLLVSLAMTSGTTIVA